MPTRDFHFRPPPASEVPAPPLPLEPSLPDVVKALEIDDPFGGSADPNDIPERITPQPRMRMAAASAAASSAAAQLGGSSPRNNPFLDQVSIQKFDINPYKILHDLNHQ